MPDPPLTSEAWRKREAIRLAGQLRHLHRAVAELFDSLHGIELLENQAVADEVVAQLRPIELHRAVHVLKLAAEAIQKARGKPSASREPRS